MDSLDYTTEHQKGKHLTYEDYVKIQVRLWMQTEGKVSLKLRAELSIYFSVLSNFPLGDQ